MIVLQGAVQQLYSVQCNNPVITTDRLANIQCRLVPGEDANCVRTDIGFEAAFALEFAGVSAIYIGMYAPRTTNSHFCWLLPSNKS